MKSSSVMPKLNTFYQKGYFRGKELSDKYYNDIIKRISNKIISGIVQFPIGGARTGNPRS